MLKEIIALNHVGKSVKESQADSSGKLPWSTDIYIHNILTFYEYCNIYTAGVPLQKLPMSKISQFRMTFRNLAITEPPLVR